MSIMKENRLEDGHNILSFDLVQCGPLNTIKSNNLRKVKTTFLDISSSSIKSNWWTEFSSWEDFNAFLLTGSDYVVVGIVLHLVQDRAELPSGMDVVVCLQCTRCKWYYRAWRR